MQNYSPGGRCAFMSNPGKPSISLSLLFFAISLVSTRSRTDMLRPRYSVNRSCACVRDRRATRISLNLAGLFHTLAGLWSPGHLSQGRSILSTGALHLCEQAQGVDHPDLVSFASRSGESLSQAEEAEYPEAAQSMYGLARFRAVRGKSEEAGGWYVRALAIFERVCGGEHARTEEIYTYLLHLLQNMGRHEEAVRLEATRSQR